MIVDCDTCVMRDAACDDCVVTVLLGAPTAWGDDEQRALGVLAASGLVPPLRLVPSRSGSEQAPEQAPEQRPARWPGQRSAGTATSGVSDDTPSRSRRAV